jgi:multicomponent K+:H+ antiporter subunit E
MSGTLFVLWLLLNQSISPGHVLLAAAAALVGGWMLAALDLPQARLRRPAAMLRLTGRVVADIVRSNIAVGRIILGWRGPGRRPGLIDIPLQLRDPYGLAVLACIITSTPGTLWVGFDAASGILTIHVLDLVDEHAWIDTIKIRYERMLMEIFE